ncbi:interleukin-1 receptor type 1-like isoform X1 [Electrophorus electricus]|uniref:interleukin-1 receptor type 1-like isoform X1 n=1 Tax=Electrophorus electricus TaxID=8005 RepID=UPI0015D0BF61|nr:interleukin-1 receptor type 1-like isoform X1 [Electrophorus electricus]
MTGVIFLLLSWSLLVSMSRCRDQQVVLHTVKSQAFSLFCDTDQHVQNVTYTWTKDNCTIKVTPRIKFQGNVIWFLSTELSDSGNYRCRSTYSSEIVENAMCLSVESGLCPRPNQFSVAWQGSNVNFSCTENRIPTMGQELQVQWWKDCKPTGMQGREISFYNMPMSGMGNYTCLVIFKYEGKTYNASYTTELIMLKDEAEKKPKVIFPRDKTVHVKPGERMKLDCTVFIGEREEETLETTVYWTINNSYTQKYPQLHENMTFEVRENNNVYGHSTLLISEVLPEFFGMPFKCTVMNPNGMDAGVLHLKQDDYNIIQTIMMISFIVGVAVMATGLFMYFKVDIILACRDLGGKGKAASQDRKLYNAYVSCYPGTGPGCSAAEDLALRLMSEVLEQRHGLRLFIHGRDNTDVEVNLAAMTDAINQSRTVVLILHRMSPANLQCQVLIPVSQGQDMLNASQRQHLCSAIAQCTIPVILVEDNENTDHSLLPECLQAVRQTQGALRWNPTVQPSGRFWKQLRYRMT